MTCGCTDKLQYFLSLIVVTAIVHHIAKMDFPLDLQAVAIDV